jgi:hypothetical protein
MCILAQDTLQGLFDLCLPSVDIHHTTDGSYNPKTAKHSISMHSSFLLGSGAGRHSSGFQRSTATRDRTTWLWAAVPAINTIQAQAHVSQDQTSNSFVADTETKAWATSKKDAPASSPGTSQDNLPWDEAEAPRLYLRSPTADAQRP